MTFPELIEVLRMRTPVGVGTGYKDRDSREIKTGDIIEFYGGESTLGSDEPVYSDRPMPGMSLSRVVDVVEVEKDEVPYALSIDTGGGVFLHRLEGICKVISNIYTNPEPLREDSIRFNGGPIIQALAERLMQKGPLQ